jgi:hypothetical protein
LQYRYKDVVKGFAMPLKVAAGGEKWITPTTEWKTLALPAGTTNITVNRNFYIRVNKTPS